jgi:hypothetical protein
MKSNAISIFSCFLFLATGLNAQNLLDFPNPHQRKHHEEKRLELEGELYFRNLIYLPENVLKSEILIDYHDNDSAFYGKKTLFGLRFFDLINEQWENRQLIDLIWYTEGYWGFKHFQLGAEMGTLSGQEYISVGPQFTDYNTRIFKRFALNTRVFPDLIFGYEFTTQELEFGHFRLSSAGTSRFIMSTEQFLIQSSIWVSSKMMKSLYWGFEYEYNSSKIEKPQELFFGLKVELN